MGFVVGFGHAFLSIRKALPRKDDLNYQIREIPCLGSRDELVAEEG